jgi:glyoxylase-like metal-dependent hydrolase (beta-lactamase superfamily II)
MSKPILVSLTILSLGLIAPSQAGQQPAGELTTDLVKTGLYVVNGGGGNSLIRLSATGVIFVNGKLPGRYRPLLGQLKRILKMSDLPVRALVVTDCLPINNGNNGEFHAAGVQLIAQRHTRDVLAASGLIAGSGLPTFAFDDQYTLRMGGIEVQLLHFGNAHTAGDTVAYFPNLKTVALGGLFSTNAPDPDYAAGGSLVGWARALDEILKLDFDVAVPAFGSPVSKSDLLAFKTRVDTAVSRARYLVSSGASKSSLPAALKTGDLGWTLDLSGERLERFYSEFAAPGTR